MKRQTSCLLAEARATARRVRVLFSALAGFALLASAAAAVQHGILAGFLLASASGAALYSLRNPLCLLGYTRTVNPIYGIQGVAASGTATLNLPVGRRYHSLRIRTVNTAGVLQNPTTIVSNLKLIVNGVTMLDASPAQLNNTASTFLITPGTGEICIFFTEPWKNDTRTAEATSWDMFGQGSFVLQVTFLNPAGGVGIQAVLADFDGLRNEQNGKPFLAILKRFNLSVNSPTGESDIVSIPTGYPLQRLLLDVSANAINSVTVYGDNNYKILEATKAQNADMLSANGVSGAFFEYPLVFDYDDKLTSNIRTSSLDLKLNCSGANTTTVHVVQLVPGYV